ncbi:MAG: winged helix-turn-helix transcriptional regulator [Pseudomonadota bacterium]
MVLLDLLGRRGALRILWELRDGVTLRFRALQAASDLSPSVLNTRLAELRENKIVALSEDGYRLTEAGADLLMKLTPLQDWSDAWARSR